MHQHLIAATVWKQRHGQGGEAMLKNVAEKQLVLVSTGAGDWLESNGSTTQTAGGYLVSAQKRFASQSAVGDMLVTSAPFMDEVLHFPVPMNGAGVTVLNDWRALGMRGTASHTVKLENVFVPDAAIALRRPRGAYHPVWNVVLTVAMPLIMSVYAGVAEAATAIAREHAGKRPGDPNVPYLLGELTNHLTTVQLAVADMVRLANDLDFTPGLDVTDAILVRKTIAAENVLATVEKALEAAGGAGFYRKAGLERLLRDAHGVQFHPLPAKRQHRFTGRIALGLDPIADAA
jgi:acyl-CoA dehydrogenase